MDRQSYHSFTFCLLIVSSILCLQSRADGSGSVFFLDSSNHQYIRPRSSDSTSESNLIVLPEIGAATSVLLGFAPPATLSASSSDKLNEVLMPNPFDRPRAVFMLEINGAEDKLHGVSADNDVFNSALKSRIVFGQTDAEIQLPDEDEVSVVSLNEPMDSDTECIDKDLTDFASWLGGSYVSTAMEPLSGELTIPLANGVQMKLHMSKKADREFTTSLVSLIWNIRKAIEMHQDLSGSTLSPAELLKGRFDGIKALQEQYGADGLVQQGVELLVTSLSKIYEALQTSYKGQIVGTILFNGISAKESGTMLNVVFTSRPSPRWLEETNGLPNATMIAEVVLVRRTLAWITGIILIISTLVGIYFLLYMPLTKDTLLYSNVKLD